MAKDSAAESHSRTIIDSLHCSDSEKVAFVQDLLQDFEAYGINFYKEAAAIYESYIYSSQPSPPKEPLISAFIYLGQASEFLLYQTLFILGHSGNHGESLSKLKEAYIDEKDKAGQKTKKDREAGDDRFRRWPLATTESDFLRHFETLRTSRNEHAHFQGSYKPGSSRISLEKPPQLQTFTDTTSQSSDLPEATEIDSALSALRVFLHQHRENLMKLLQCAYNKNQEEHGGPQIEVLNQLRPLPTKTHGESPGLISPKAFREEICDFLHESGASLIPLIGASTSRASGVLPPGETMEYLRYVTYRVFQEDHDLSSKGFPKYPNATEKGNTQRWFSNLAIAIQDDESSAPSLEDNPKMPRSL